MHFTPFTVPIGEFSLYLAIMQQPSHVTTQCHVNAYSFDTTSKAFREPTYNFILGFQFVEATFTATFITTFVATIIQIIIFSDHV